MQPDTPHVFEVLEQAADHDPRGTELARKLFMGHGHAPVLALAEELTEQARQPQIELLERTTGNLRC